MQCAYKHDKLPGYECPYPVEMDDFCVFHIRKCTKEEKEKLFAAKGSQNERLEAKFWSEFNRILNNEIPSSKDFYDFRGFNFPQLNLRTEVFTKPAC